MKALVWHGKEDIRCDSVSDPSIEHPRDAIIKVTSCATLLDVACAQALRARHQRSSESPRDYSGRSGFPQGVAAARGAAADCAVPEDMRALSYHPAS